MIKLFLHNEFNIISKKWSFVLRIQYGCCNLKHYIFIPGSQVGEKGRGKTNLLTSKEGPQKLSSASKRLQRRLGKIVLFWKALWLTWKMERTHIQKQPLVLPTVTESPLRSMYNLFYWSHLLNDPIDYGLTAGIEFSSLIWAVAYTHACKGYRLR